MLVTLGVATAVISLVVTRSALFEGVRNKAAHVRLIGEVVSCPFCFSHWVSAVLVALARPVVVETEWALFSYFLSWMAIVAIAAPIACVVFISHKMIGKS